MDKYLYYCENCDKLFKLSNKGKKVKCTKCGAMLKDLEITSSDYEALSPDEKEVLKMWTVVDNTRDEAETDALSRRTDKIDEKSNLHDQSSVMPGLETESSEPDTLFAGSGSSLFSSVMSETDSEAKTESVQDTATDDNYGQDDTGLDSGSDFDGDLDFFFENQDEGIRTPGIASDKGSGAGASSSNEKKLDSGSDYGMDDDYDQLFGFDEEPDNKEDHKEQPSQTQGSEPGPGFFGGSASSQDSGSGTGLGLFDGGSGNSESTGLSSSGSDSGGFSFFGSMGVDRGITVSSGSAGGSGSSFFGGTDSGVSSSTGSEPLYDNMNSASSGAYDEKPAVTGGTMYSGPKSVPSSFSSAGTFDDDPAMKMLDILSWAFGLAPFIMGVINLILSKIGIQVGSVFAIVVYIVIMALDSNYMRQLGAEVGIGWKILGVLLFPPAYLFKKADAIGQKKTAAYVSLAAWILSLILIFFVMAAVFAALSFL